MHPDTTRAYDLAATVKRIAHGHASTKHLASGEFVAGRFGKDTGVKDIPTFEQHIHQTMVSPRTKAFKSLGRDFFYNSGSNTLVVVDPASPDQGSCWRAKFMQKEVRRIVLDEERRRLKNSSLAYDQRRPKVYNGGYYALYPGLRPAAEPAPVAADPKSMIKPVHPTGVRA